MQVWSCHWSSIEFITEKEKVKWDFIQIRKKTGLTLVMYTEFYCLVCCICEFKKILLEFIDNAMLNEFCMMFIKEVQCIACSSLHSFFSFYWSFWEKSSFIVFWVANYNTLNGINLGWWMVIWDFDMIRP